jgi:hypothetical protein
MEGSLSSRSDAAGSPKTVVIRNAWANVPIGQVLRALLLGRGRVLLISRSFPAYRVGPSLIRLLCARFSSTHLSTPVSALRIWEPHRTQLSFRYRQHRDAPQDAGKQRPGRTLGQQEPVVTCMSDEPSDALASRCFELVRAQVVAPPSFLYFGLKPVERILHFSEDGLPQNSSSQLILNKVMFRFFCKNKDSRAPRKALVVANEPYYKSIFHQKAGDIFER